MRIRILNNRLTGILCLALGFSASMAVIPKNVTFTNFFGTTVPFNKPIYFSEMKDKPGYYIVLEQWIGQISVITKVNNVWTKTVLDTVTVVNNQNEMGLLGIAFHPNFAQNRKYYLNYNPTSTKTYVVERQTDSTLVKRNTAVASRILLNINQPYTNHNGGTIEFGPKDGYLYIGMGDGGSAGDPQNRAQNADSLLGKFLRIDVNTQTNGRQYGIPSDNPFVGGGHAEEVYALGARNPFKWSFDTDPTTGNVNLWLGHVGQNLWEWASLVPKGSNLGWRVAEGSHCFTPATGCSMTGFQPTFINYSHTPAVSDSTGNCIIGGYVYRGNPLSPFYGVYFYGDNGSNRVWAIKTDGVVKQDWAVEGTLSSTTGTLTSFGTDRQGNIYAVARGTSTTNGTIYALTSPDLTPVPISPRRTGKIFVPHDLRNLSGMDLHNLQGQKVQQSAVRNGVYVTQRPGDNAPALVPVLK